MSLLSEIAKNKLADPSAAKKYLDQITNAGVEVASSLDELVWAVNPKNDKLEKLIFYIIQYVENYLSLTDLKFSFKFPDEIPDRFVSAEMRHNIFSVIKEAMNNAVKYSGAERVFLEFRLTGKKLEAIFNDDGKGIDFDKVGEFSNGISNMKTRMKSINGEFKIYNRPDGGAEIYISVEA
jgi:signal transduction histidine kinase